MPDKWRTSVLVTVFKGKDVKICNAYRGVKLLEHATRISRSLKRVLKRRIQKLVNVDGIQFDSMPGRGTSDAMFVVRRM